MLISSMVAQSKPQPPSSSCLMISEQPRGLHIEPRLLVRTALHGVVRPHVGQMALPEGDLLHDLTTMSDLSCTYISGLREMKS